MFQDTPLSGSDIPLKTLQNEAENGSVSLSQASDPNQAKLTWRIKVKDTSLHADQQISLRGVVLLDKLVEERTARFQSFLDKVLSQLFFFKEESQTLNKKVAQLEKAKEETLRQYSLLVQDKQSLEFDIYSRVSSRSPLVVTLCLTVQLQSSPWS
jgi:hypothetical protein